MQLLSRRLLLPLAAFLVLIVAFETIVLLDRRSVDEAYREELAANERKRRDLLRPQVSDYVQGDVDATVMLVVYADPECQYCKQLHFKLNQLLAEYQSQGASVARMHRHAPLGTWDKSITEARAAECAAEGGGADSFYTFLDHMYTATPSNNGLDLELLPLIAEESGADAAAYTACMASGRYLDKVQEQKLTSTILSVGPIPHTFIVGPEAVYEIVGNKPEETFRFLINQALTE